MKILIPFLLLSLSVFSQDTGSVVGTLVDDSAKCIPNACVAVLTGRDGHAHEGLVSTRTNQQGEFSLENLPVGTYYLSIDLMDEYHGGVNYSDQMRLEMTISAGESLNLDKVVFEPNLICICEVQTVPYVEPRNPFGRSITLKGDDLLMR